MNKRNWRRLFFIFTFQIFVTPVYADVAEDLANIRSDISANKLKEAEKKLSNLASNHSDNVDVLYLISQLQIKQSNWEDAKRNLERLIKLAPESAEPYNELAAIHAKRGDLSTAIDLLQKGIASQKTFVVMYENLNKIYAYQASKAYMVALEGNDKGSPPPTIDLATIKTDDWEIKTQAQPSMIVSVSDAIPISAKNDTSTSPNVDISELQNNVLKTVKDWASAWSKQEVARYLSFYDNKFQPPQSLARPLWEKSRRDRILGPKFINVEVREPSIEIADDGSLASVTFFQYYRSDSFNQSTKKLLVLRRKDNEWRILNEYSES